MMITNINQGCSTILFLLFTSLYTLYFSYGFFIEKIKVPCRKGLVINSMKTNVFKVYSNWNCDSIEQDQNNSFYTLN
jgi:hypothetical protein